MNLSTMPSRPRVTDVSANISTGDHNRIRRPQQPSEWEAYRDLIADLYASHELKEVMKIMEKEHCFKATVKQYKSRITNWGLDTKCIKPSEYKAILKQTRKRRREAPGKPTQFYLHDKEVPPVKVAKWENRMLRQGKITVNDTFYDVAIPPSLICRTPSPVTASPCVDIKELAFYSPPITVTVAAGPVPPLLDLGFTGENDVEEISRAPPKEHRCDYNQNWNSKASRQYIELKARNKAISQCVLYHDSVDEFLTRTHSNMESFVNGNLPAFQRSPSPALSERSLRSIKSSPRLSRSPSLSPSEWWSSWREFITAPPEAIYLTPARHRFEELVRFSGQRIDKYDDHCYFMEILDKYGSCESGCGFCTTRGLTPMTSPCCTMLRLVRKFTADFEYGKITEERYHGVYAHAICQFLPDFDPTPPDLSSFFFPIISIKYKDLDLSTIIFDFAKTFFSSSDRLSQSSWLNIARILTWCGKWEDSIRVLQHVFGVAYEEMLSICEQSDLPIYSSAEAVARLTKERVRLYHNDAGSSFFQKVGNSDNWGSDSWYLKKDGSLDSDELELRSYALIAMAEIKQWSL